MGLELRSPGRGPGAPLRLAPLTARGPAGARPWRRLQRAKNDLIFGLARALMGLVGRLPLSWTLSIGASLGLLAWAVVGPERRKVLANLRLAFPALAPPALALLARRCFVSLGRRAAEICWLERLDLLSYVELPEEDLRAVETALAHGRGLIWVTAHLGNWELLAAGLAARGLEVRPVATESYDPRFTALIDGWRRSRGVRTIWRGRDGVAAAIDEALRSGAILGLLIDQDTRTRGCFVPFFGRLAWTPSGAAELARISGAPVVTGFVFRRPGGGYVLRARPVELARGADVAELDRANTALLTEAIEDAIRRDPQEWVWMHERWRTRPADEGGAPS